MKAASILRSDFSYIFTFGLLTHDHDASAQEHYGWRGTAKDRQQIDLADSECDERLGIIDKGSEKWVQDKASAHSRFSVACLPLISTELILGRMVTALVEKRVHVLPYTGEFHV